MKPRAASWSVVPLALCLLGFARDARSSTMPSFSALPEGHVGMVPRKVPGAIGAWEHVPGIVAALPPAGQRDGAEWVQLFSNSEDAKHFRRGDGNPTHAPEVCYTTSERALQSLPAPRDKAPLEWPSFFEATPTLMGRQVSYGTVSGGVVAVHAEKLVRAAGTAATLEMTDAWVDPHTQGVRLIERGALPLLRVATGPASVEVYAARNGDEVEYVVSGPKLPPGTDASVEQSARGQFLRLVASLGDNRFATSDCGHMRIALRGGENGPVLGVVQTTVVLPAVEKEEAADPAVPALAGFRALQAMRKRPLSISLSATQSSSDKEPVVSVAVGWAGRELRR